MGCLFPITLKTWAQGIPICAGNWQEQLMYFPKCSISSLTWWNLVTGEVDVMA